MIRQVFESVAILALAYMCLHAYILLGQIYGVL